MRRRFARCCARWTAVLACLALPLAVASREAADVGQDPAVERHMMELAKELRCLVCQNQTIADSQADLAGDLRQQIRELLQKGMSDDEIKRYMVARYGDFVLYRPPLKSETWLLWFGPALLMAAGLSALYLVLLRRRRAFEAAAGGAADVRADVAALTPEQHQRAQALLSEDERKPG